MKICEGLTLDPKTFNEQMRGLRHVREAPQAQGKEVFKVGHIVVLEFPPGTYKFGGNFMINYDNGYNASSADTLAKAKSYAKRYAKKWPAVGDWWKTPATSYGKKRLVVAQVIKVSKKSGDYVVRFEREAWADEMHEFEIPLSLLIYEGSKMRKPPKGK